MGREVLSNPVLNLLQSVKLAIRDINNNIIMFDTQQQAEDYLDKIKKCKYYSTDDMLGGMCKRCSSFKEAMPEIAFCADICENYAELYNTTYPYKEELKDE